MKKPPISESESQKVCLPNLNLFLSVASILSNNLPWNKEWDKNRRAVQTHAKVKSVGIGSYLDGENRFRV